MKNNYFLSLLAILFLAVFTSCSKNDEPTPADNRTQLEGTYNYKAKFYTINSSGSLVYAGSEYDQIGTLIGKKNATDSNKIDFLEGGEMAFQGNKIAVASNGLTFDIPTQTITEDGETITILGYEGVTLGTSKYHGLYTTGDKKVNAYFQLQGYNIVMHFEATKI